MQRSIALLLLLVLTACASTKGKAPTPSALTDTASAPRVLLRPTCVVKENRGATYGTEALPAAAVAIITAVAPKIVDAVIDAGASYLERRKTELTGSSSARGAGHLFATTKTAAPPKPEIGCVVFVRGSFGSPPSAAVGHWTVNQLKALGLSAPPALYAEFQVVYSGDLQAFRLRPVYLDYQRTSAKRLGSKTKDLIFTGYFESPFGPLAEMDTHRFGAFQVAFPGTTVPTTWDETALEGITSQWIPLPQPTQYESPGTGAGTKNKDWTRNPVTVFVTAQETEEAGDLLLKVTKVYNDSKADVSKAISDWIKNAVTPKKDEEKKDEDAKDQP